MRRFRFRLAKVLDARRARERSSEARLLATRLALSRAIGAEEHTGQRMRASRARLETMLAGPLQLAEIEWEGEHLLALGALAAFRREQTRAAERRVHQALDELLSARRERKMLERLSERQFAQHQSLALRQEMLEIEDCFRMRRSAV